MDQERRRLYAAGGPGLRGIYRALCEYAGDRPYLRGFLLTPDDRPATPDDLASALHLPAKEIAKALRTLSEMQPVLVQRVLYEDVEKDLLEARMASQPGKTTPTGGESIRDEEVGEHPSDGGSRCSRSICSPEMTDGPRPSGSDGAPGASCPPPATEETSKNVHPGGESGRGWRPPGPGELPMAIDRLTEAEWIDNTGLGWNDVRYELGKSAKFGQLIAWAIGVGVGRAAQDEIQAFAARWDEILAAPIDEGYRIWLAEKLYALAVELNERRMKELRQGRTDPPNYRKIWMAEAKRGLQAAVTATARGVHP
jgi:hypothetical protein